MAEKAKDLKKIADETNEVLGQVLDAVSSIGDALIQSVEDFNDGLDDSNKAVDIIGKTMKRGLVSELKQTVKNQEELIKLQVKAEKGEAKSSDIAKQKNKIYDNQRLLQIKLENLKKNQSNLSEEELKKQEELIQAQFGQIDNQLEIIDGVEKLQDKTAVQKGIFGGLVENAKEYLIDLDKSGIAAALLNGNLSITEKFSLASEAAFYAMGDAMLEGSSNINDLQKNLGLSYEASRDLQLELATTAYNSKDILITSQELNKSFTELASTTGIVSDFGGDTLMTMTMLTQQLGLGVKEASQLALLARSQGEDTESTLENTVETVNAINKQNGVAISAKEVLNDISTASKSIVVSLGMSPSILAEAATEARALGLNLEDVDKIAGSLLDFESSIANELKAEVLLGKEINLEKARQAALNNDLVTLTEEIGKNEAITESFATGNRIQQEAAAAALGMSRDELANMVYQQEILTLGAEGFKDAYGEQAYQSMLAQDASEKFEKSIAKIKGVIGDVGTAFAPLIDGFAALVGYLAESKILLGVIAGTLVGLAAVQATMAIRSLVEAYAKMFAAGALGGPAGLAIAIGGAAALGGLVAGASQMVQDGIAPPGNGPFTITDAYGATAITAKGDGLAVSPNISNGGGSQERTNMLLEKLLAKDTNINMDGRKLNDSMKSSAVAYNIGT
tara:strand:+ start:1746 stop:3785 length:2040 start_codon:yes stop_codon:yes gene_type:complete